ncbi:hypothetical protein TWF694_011395 [Orbilia ellipsospora]|uniref:Replication termination factor 2 n=1 Tax=Orbilia ellipsospora TaxID=2528407 RepID=A0AAV9XBB8_9PEZI
MGNDGGSIPTRRELVKSPTRAKTTSELRTQSSQNSTYHWSFCPLSKQPLVSPIASDSLGRLFNRPAVLEWLLKPSSFGDGEEVMKTAGVKSLKDIVQVKFEVSSSEDAKDSNEGVVNGGILNGGGSGRKEVWVCPITRKELGPGSHAVYLIPCGHAFAEAAVREIKEDICLVCSEKFDKLDGVVKINPTEDADIEKLKKRRERLTAASLSHSLQKASSKKRKNKEDKKEGKKEKEKKSTTAGDIASKVLGDEQGRAKKRKMEMSDNVRSLFTSSSKPEDRKPKDADFMTRGFTIPVKNK